MVASTLTTVSVFLPIVFVTGIAGQIFKELAWVVVVTQVISAIIAFTLLPMLIAKVGEKSSLTKRDIHDDGFGGQPSEKPATPFGYIARIFEKIMEMGSIPITAIEKLYVKMLPAFLAAKWFFLLIIFMVFLGSLYLFTTMDKILLPKVDQKQFMIKIDLPVGSRVEFTNRISQRVEKHVLDIPAVKSAAAIIGSSKGENTKEVLERLGSHQSQIVVTVKSDSEIPTDQVVQKVRQYFELSEGKKLIGIFDVEVSYDVTRLSNELARRFPGSQITASSVNGRIMLSGSAHDAVTLDKAVTIARNSLVVVRNRRTSSSR